MPAITSTHYEKRASGRLSLLADSGSCPEEGRLSPGAGRCQEAAPKSAFVAPGGGPLSKRKQ
jgi:hypothetical protein